RYTCPTDPPCCGATTRWRCGKPGSKLCPALGGPAAPAQAAQVGSSPSPCLRLETRRYQSTTAALFPVHTSCYCTRPKSRKRHGSDSPSDATRPITVDLPGLGLPRVCRYQRKSRLRAVRHPQVPTEFHPLRLGESRCTERRRRTPDGFGHLRHTQPL